MQSPAALDIVAFMGKAGLQRFSTLSFAASVAGCTTIRQPLPSDVGPEYLVLEVRDRSRWGNFSNESFKLGSYVIQGVDRASDQASSSKVGEISTEAHASGGAFALKDGAIRLDGKCSTGTAAQQVSFGKVLKLTSEASTIACSCQRGERVARVFLGGDGYDLEGTLQTSVTSYAIKSLHQVDKGAVPAEPTGYRIDGERPVGVVDALFPGGVWLDPKLSDDERRELACLFAGLMLYKPERTDP